MDIDRKHACKTNRNNATQKLKERILKVNGEKTGLYTVRKKANDDWRKCKYLPGT